MWSEFWSEVKYRPVFYTIGILGLSIGSTLLFFLLSFYESDQRYDRHHTAYNRLYRLETTFHLPSGETLPSARAPLAIVEPLKNYFSSQIKDITALQRINTNVKVGTLVERVSVYFADSSFLKMLNPYDDNEIDMKPGEAIISKKLARQLFSNNNPVGERLQFDQDRSLTIIKVVELAPNTHLSVDLLTSVEGDWSIDFESERQNWYDTTSYVYLKLDTDGSLEVIQNQLQKFINVTIPEIPGAPFSPADFFEFRLRPITEVHYDVGLPDDIFTTIDSISVFYLKLVITAVLLISILNFINLTTVVEYAKSRTSTMKRLLGASLRALLGESILQSFITVLIVMLVTSLFVFISHGYYNKFLQWSGIPVVHSPGAIATLIGLILITVCLSKGLLVVFLNLRPIVGMTVAQYDRISPPIIGRITLMIQIFVTASLLWIGSGMYLQTTYLQKSDHGYIKDNLLVIPARYLNEITGEGDAIINFKHRLMSSEKVEAISFSSWRAFDSGRSMWDLSHSRQTSERELLLSNLITGDESFFDVWSISVLAGKVNLTKIVYTETQSKTDSINLEKHSRPVVINRRFVQKLGFQNLDDVIGYELYGNVDDNTVTFRVVAVCEDFYLGALSEKIVPLMIELNPSPQRYISIRVNSIIDMEWIQEQFQLAGATGNPNARWISDITKKHYENTRSVTNIVIVAAVLCILFALLGVFTIGAHEALRMRKVFAIMTSMGGSYITNLEYYLQITILPVVISMMLSVIVGSQVLSKWLNQFDTVSGYAQSVPFLSIVLFLTVTIVCLASCLFWMTATVMIRDLNDE